MTATIDVSAPHGFRPDRLHRAFSRFVIAATSVWVCFELAIDRWRALEAGVVVAVLRLLDVAGVQRVGDQILVVSGAGHTFSADIGPLCSSLGIVLAFGASAGLVATGDPRQRLRAFVIGAAIVVTCNLVRIGATVVVGVESGPGAIEPFHDGIATWFAVAFVLTSLGLFVTRLPGFDMRRSAVAAQPPVQR